MDAHDPSYRVVEAVARAEGVSPTELSPLFSAVDPQALDAVAQTNAASNSGHVEIEFTYRDYVVRVESGQSVSISVQEADASTDTSEPSSEKRASSEE